MMAGHALVRPAHCPDLLVGRSCPSGPYRLTMAMVSGVQTAWRRLKYCDLTTDRVLIKGRFANKLVKQ